MGLLYSTVRPVIRSNARPNPVASANRPVKSKADMEREARMKLLQTQARGFKTPNARVR